MSKGVNKVILVGNLGNDPETKYTQGGMAITSISLATTSVHKDRDGNKQEKTEWHRVKFFGKLAEIAGEYLRKGSQVYIEGELRYSKVDGDDGVKYFTDIVANEMQILGSRSDSAQTQRGSSSGTRGGAPQRQRQADAHQRSQQHRQDDFADNFDDDIPFIQMLSIF